MVNEFNEISYAEKMIKDGFCSNRKMYEINILAKYYFYQGLKPKEVYDKLVAFCDQHFENFNEALYFNKLQSIVKNAQKSEIHQIDGVPITQKDIDYIKSFGEDDRFNRVLLGLMAFKKIRLSFNQKPYLNCKYSKFSRYCKLNKTKDIYAIIKKMEGFGIVRVCRNSNVEILVPIDDGESIFTIYDIYNVGSYWNMYIKKGRYTHCEMCGKIIPVKGSWRKFCGDCVKVQHRMFSRRSMQKLRSCQVEQ